MDIKQIGYLINPNECFSYYFFINNGDSEPMRRVLFEDLPSKITEFHTAYPEAKHIIFCTWPDALNGYVEMLQAAVGKEIKLYTTVE